MSHPVMILGLDTDLISMVEHADVLIATKVDQQLALELARDYARFLMGYRAKSPDGSELSIMQNQFVRSETWIIVRRYGALRRAAPQWERYHENKGRIVI